MFSLVCYSLLVHSCGHISINQIDLPEGYKAPKLTDPPSEYLSEPDGLINMSKYFELTEGTAILRTTIESPVDQQVDFIFDYSEHLAISLNSEIIFSESLRMNDNGGRVMD